LVSSKYQYCLVHWRDPAVKNVLATNERKDVWNSESQTSANLPLFSQDLTRSIGSEY
jgi:hypothetical protein